jgi:hypothetical protein
LQALVNFYKKLLRSTLIVILEPKKKSHGNPVHAAGSKHIPSSVSSNNYFRTGKMSIQLTTRHVYSYHYLHAAVTTSASVQPSSLLLFRTTRIVPREPNNIIAVMMGSSSNRATWPTTTLTSLSLDNERRTYAKCLGTVPGSV